MTHNRTKIKPISNEQKMTIQLFLGVGMAVIGLVLLWVSMFIPPMGVIDASVLTAFGEVGTFAGALMGMDYTYKYKSIKYVAERDWRGRQQDKEENESTDYETDSEA